MEERSDNDGVESDRNDGGGGREGLRPRRSRGDDGGDEDNDGDGGGCGDDGGDDVGSDSDEDYDGDGDSDENDCGDAVGNGTGGLGATSSIKASLFRRWRIDPAGGNGVYEEDLWIEVAKYLDGRDLVQLALTNRWFYRLILEESVWKYACIRDLHVPSPHHVSFNWLQLYASAFDWMRIGAFFFETPSAVLTEKLALPSKLTELSENHERDIQLSGTCILTDIRTGIWIAEFGSKPLKVVGSWGGEGLHQIRYVLRDTFARDKGIICVDFQLVRCPVCNLHTCEGTMQILDVRHLELFLEEGFRNGSWEFDELGSHRIEKPSKSAAGGVFDYSHVYSSCTAGLLDTSRWLGESGDWQPKARLSTHAVAVSTNLQPNDGLNVRFQAMRSKGSDEKVVSIRISQQLI
ncbi:putative F-box protein [Platanthera guangdongensis]|uniref:F-box protein n=1 Tax=Platanthera guangdongensis TaxID=2320717 RepID=A0ABR2M0Z3_9ASPA